jgi:hypothetical protein
MSCLFVGVGSRLHYVSIHMHHAWWFVTNWCVWPLEHGSDVNNSLKVQLLRNSSSPWCNSSSLNQQQFPYICVNLSNTCVQYLGSIKFSFVLQSILVRREYTSCCSFFAWLHVMGPYIGVFSAWLGSADPLLDPFAGMSSSLSTYVIHGWNGHLSSGCLCVEIKVVVLVMVLELLLLVGMVVVAVCVCCCS